ncbi:MAG: hypothetical protein WD887_01270 [Candidatus Saccharimonadales bacterium]
MDAAAKTQIVERVKQANNILVTVSNNPSVDQLASCIGLTLLLNRMGKHATAVFSGTVPSTIEFLQPAKTLETNTDSLRDFIISLDKSKADKLRYKVEDQVVRIFITPYKTSLSQKDLVFSEGDFNVEVVMALGIHDRSQIDAAITAHGRILHDATVISVNAGPGKAPDVGQINWQEPTASSLSEMLVSISEAFGPGLIDNQMATAFLTGIVAETERFSNPKTSPKVMTISAQLMAAGANQQLIVSKLEPPTSTVPKKVEFPKTPKSADKAAAPVGMLNISHDEKKPDSPEVQVDATEIHIDEQGNIQPSGGSGSKPAAQPSLKPQSIEPLLPPTPPKAPIPPSDMPGQHSLLDPQNRPPALGTPFTAATQPEWYDPYNSVPIDPLSETKRPGDSLLGQGLPNQASGDISAPVVDQARNAVETALATAPAESSGVQSLDLGTPNFGGEPSAHPSSEPNGTPSLSLPTNGAPGAPAPAESIDVAPPAPPPLPPPLPTSPQN